MVLGRVNKTKMRSHYGQMRAVDPKHVTPNVGKDWKG